MITNVAIYLQRYSYDGIERTTIDYIQKIYGRTFWCFCIIAIWYIAIKGLATYFWSGNMKSPLWSPLFHSFATRFTFFACSARSHTYISYSLLINWDYFKIFYKKLVRLYGKREFKSCNEIRNNLGICLCAHWQKLPSIILSYLPPIHWWHPRCSEVKSIAIK